MTLPHSSADDRSGAHTHGARLQQFFAELKRRKVYRVAVAYIVAAWVLAQVATQIFPFFEIPTWAVRLVIIALILGFPIAVVLAWAYDITPSGIKRTEGIAPAPPVTVPEKSIAVLPFENQATIARTPSSPMGSTTTFSLAGEDRGPEGHQPDLSTQYRTGARNLREIGEALGVAHVLEGTVRRAGNRVR